MSDEKIAGKDTFRKQYRAVDDVTKSRIHGIKVNAETVEQLLDLIEEDKDRSFNPRCLSLARTNLEQAVMWAIKAIT